MYVEQFSCYKTIRNSLKQQKPCTKVECLVSNPHGWTNYAVLVVPTVHLHFIARSIANGFLDLQTLVHAGTCDSNW